MAPLGGCPCSSRSSAPYSPPPSAPWWWPWAGRSADALTVQALLANHKSRGRQERPTRGQDGRRIGDRTDQTSPITVTGLCVRLPEDLRDRLVPCGVGTWPAANASRCRTNGRRTGSVRATRELRQRPAAEHVIADEGRHVVRRGVAPLSVLLRSVHRAACHGRPSSRR